MGRGQFQLLSRLASSSPVLLWEPSLVRRSPLVTGEEDNAYWPSAIALHSQFYGAATYSVFPPIYT